MQRPTSFVWVVRVAMSRSSSRRCSSQKSAKTAPTSTPEAASGDAANVRHRVVVGGQRVVRSREKKEVHGGEQQERAPLGERSVVEQREDACVVGDAAADGWVDGAAVTLDHGGEGRGSGRPAAARRARGQKLAGSSGLTAPKKNQSSTSMPTRADAPDQPALAAEAPGREEDGPPTSDGTRKPQNSVWVELDVRVAGQVAALRIRVQSAGTGRPVVREELRVGQLGLDDQAGRGAEARIAGRQRERGWRKRCRSRWCRSARRRSSWWCRRRRCPAAW